MFWVLTLLREEGEVGTLGLDLKREARGGSEWLKELRGETGQWEYLEAAGVFGERV